MGGQEEVVKYIDYVLIFCSVIFSALAAIGAVYAWPWSRCSRKENSLTEYNSVWGVRVCLQMTAAFWMLSPVLQLHETWTPKVDVLERWNVRGSFLCQLFLSARLGLFEPFFLFLGLFALKHSLQQGQGWELMSASGFGHTPPASKHTNASIVGRAVLNTAPILAVQTLLALLTSIFLNDVDGKTGARTVFLFSHVLETKGCPGIGLDGSRPSSGCFVCVYPLVSTMVSALFVMYYLYRLWETTSEMMRITVNHSLTQRMILFRSVVTIVLTLGVLCRGLTVTVAPRSVLYELMRLGDFISAVFFVIAVSYSLVLKPVHDSRFAEKINKSGNIWKEVDLTDALKSDRMV